MIRYTLRLTNGEKVVIEANPADVIHGEHGISFYFGRRATGTRRTFPWVNVIEETSERVAWRAVEVAS